MADNNDPFEQFRNLFEQFDATGSLQVPPAPGFPLSLFPMLGADSGGLSPEDSTKRTVRQLYSALSGLSGNQGSESLVDAWQQYAEMFDFDTSVSGAPEQIGSAAMATYRVWFYSLAQILVESYTLRLLHDELVIETHQATTDTQKWLWSLLQTDREQLLRRCTTVEDDLVDEMETARNRRDKLLYDFSSWTEANFDDSLAGAKLYLRVLTALDDLVTDETGFSYFPDSAETDAHDAAGTDNGGDDSTDG